MGQMIDFNRALQETRQMIEPPDMGMIRFNNWAKRQNAIAHVPQDEDWQAEQRGDFEASGMEGYRPNSSLVPGVSVPQEYNRSSGVGIEMPVDVPAPEAEQVPEAPVEQQEEQATEQQGNVMLASIQQELRANDDGTYQYAMSVLQRLPKVFARYENADPSRAMPYFLSGQPGRQRETEIVRFNEFMR